MEDKELEKLFKEGLSREGEFSRADSQWSILEDRLESSNRKPLLFWVLSGVIFMIAVFVCIQTVKTNIDSNILPEEPNRYNVLSSVDPIDAEVEPIEVEKEKLAEIEKRDDANQEDVIASLDREKVSGREIESVGKKLKNNAKKNITPINQLQYFDARINIDKKSNLKSDDEECMVCEEEEQERLRLSASTDEADNTIVQAEEQSVKKVVNEAVSLTQSVFKIPLINAHLVVIPLLPSFNLMARATETPVVTKDLKNYSMHILAGAVTDKVTDISTIDTSSLRPYLGLSYEHRSGFGGSIKYTWGEIRRNIKGGLEAYNIPVNAPGYESILLDSTQVNFKNRSFDLDLTKGLFNYKGLGIHVLTGIQINTYQNSDVTYNYPGYGGPYQVNVVKARLDDIKFKVSDIKVGSRMTYMISCSLILEGQYQYHIPVGSSYRWGDRHRFFVGLNYSIIK